MDALLWGAYATTCIALTGFGMHRLWLLACFRWREFLPLSRTAETLPKVTVQLPLFNERTVAPRIIRACAALDYPRDRLEIQVLDDSTDETREIVAMEVARLRERGLRAHVLRRESRVGFKAGALALGQERAEGELLCVFDADFVPEPDFLRNLVGAFEDPGVAMVQVRWGHINRDASWFTRAQAALLDGHFVVTHKVRFDRDLFFHFNGTAGIWRRSAILRAGGWQHDTLTEDLDLSYRSQLAGDRLVYVPQLAAPAELPEDIASFKTQQTRWARGAVQVCRKLAGSIARAPVRPRVKLEAAVHFLGHAGHPFVLALALLLPWTGLWNHASNASLLLAAPVLSLPATLAFHWVSLRAIGRPQRLRLLDSMLALLLGLGMSWELTRAVLRGLAPGTGEFVRTPKRGERATRRYHVRMPSLAGFELLLAAWTGLGCVRALDTGRFGVAGFLALYTLGFLWVGALSLAQRQGRRAADVRPATCPPDDAERSHPLALSRDGVQIL